MTTEYNERMDAGQIRKKYLDFMKKSGHKIIEPASLVLENDPTTLFTGSGMQPLMPYLLGEKHPEGERLADSQPSFRSQDINDIGDNRHTVFFEMLGNWSLGNYFKEKQIHQFFNFLTKELNLNPEKIFVTCFIGDEKNHIPRDDEAAEIWQKVFKNAGVSHGIAEIDSSKNGDKRGIKDGERIFFYNDKENWWSRGGDIEKTPIGDPCGPDSEVFYDFGEENHDESFGKAHPASDSGRFMEIGNQVFMQYRRLSDGSFEPLKQKNVDFGGGLERIAAAAINSPDIFEISLIKPIITEIETITNKKYQNQKAAMRVIADHIRASVFLASGGLLPSNKEHGYVLRRLVRRAILKAKSLGVEQDFIKQIIPIISDIYGDFYPVIRTTENQVIAILAKEEKVFRQTLNKGLKTLEKLASDGLTGKELFILKDTYGFPLELALEEIETRQIKLSPNWQAEFDLNLLEQKKRSQTATKGMFKGGLEDHSDMTVRYHTAAHLLGAAMKQVLGESVEQKGCNINAERLRFDFSWHEKLTPTQITEIETKVNTWIEANLKVTHSEYDTDFAFEKLHAHGVFRNRYGDKVTVYQIGDVSNEICGGPHVKHTGEINGKFKIVKEESSSAGVRRVKAVITPSIF
jgi:alanyl-tRNA synthetase